jgi:hypothetical protein
VSQFRKENINLVSLDIDGVVLMRLGRNTSVLATKTQCMDRIVREAIEIELHHNNMKREVGSCLSKSWKPLIYSLKKSDTGSTRPRMSMHARQSSPEVIGSMPTR